MTAGIVLLYTGIAILAINLFVRRVSAPIFVLALASLGAGIVLTSQ